MCFYFITYAKKTFKGSSFCDFSNFNNGFVWNPSKVQRSLFERIARLSFSNLNCLLLFVVSIICISCLLKLKLFNWVYVLSFVYSLNCLFIYMLLTLFNLRILRCGKLEESQSPAHVFHTAWKGSVFWVILIRIFPHSDWIRRDMYSVRMRKNADQNNSEYGHVSRIVHHGQKQIRFIYLTSSSNIESED